MCQLAAHWKAHGKVQISYLTSQSYRQVCWVGCLLSLENVCHVNHSSGGRWHTHTHTVFFNWFSIIAQVLRAPVTLRNKVVLTDINCLHPPCFMTNCEHQTITSEQHLCSLMFVCVNLCPRDYFNGADSFQYHGVRLKARRVSSGWLTLSEWLQFLG